MPLYVATNEVTAYQYVGKTELAVNKRWIKHLSDARKSLKCYLHRAICKYGAENFTVREISLPPNRSLNEWEIILIDVLDSRAPHGYNLTDGGEGTSGRIASEETRQKLSKASLGNKNSLGCKRSEETRQKLSKANTGKHPSEETRQKISEAMSGENNPNFGKHPSEETRKKISLAKKDVRRTKALARQGNG